MLVTIGQPGDSEDDPTILWPDNRKGSKGWNIDAFVGNARPEGWEL
jgi:hypothetical protein